MEPFFKFATKRNILNLFLILIIIVSLVAIYEKMSNSSSHLPSLFSTQPTPTSTPILTPTPTPTPRPIPHGKKTFTVGGGKKNAPHFSKGEINPCDPQEGEVQTITIKITSQSPVIKAISGVITDHQTQDIPMKLVKGSTTNGIWRASWKVKDSYNYNYRIKIRATSKQGTQKIEITLR